MPRIFDNIDQKLLPAIQQTLAVAYRADFCKAHDLNLYAAMRDAIVDALGAPDNSAEIMVDRQGRPVPDTDLRDIE
ncbi:MAG: hypothetical protein JXA33_07265, partial [Anaerolineae bacterium]|nr:hypothetical protein [Anaerolineae bacterium]